MNPLQQLTELFAEFPGIGARQAKRFVYYLLTRNPQYINNLSNLIRDIRKDIHTCSTCFRFYERRNANSTLCDICANPNRDTKTLIIVARDVDLENIERTRAYNGKYFVLGGSVPILEKNPETRVRSKELIKAVEDRAFDDDLSEIIVAMNLTAEGENTGEYVEQILKPIVEKNHIKISHLGRGISTGTELEYSDSETLKNALQNRH